MSLEVGIKFDIFFYGEMLFLLERGLSFVLGYVIMIGMRKVKEFSSLIG